MGPRFDDFNFVIGKTFLFQLFFRDIPHFDFQLLQAFLVPGRSEIINVRITDVVGFSKETVCTTIDDLLRQIIELLIGISHKPGIQNMIVVPAAVKAHQTKPH